MVQVAPLEANQGGSHLLVVVAVGELDDRVVAAMPARVAAVVPAQVVAVA